MAAGLGTNKLKLTIDGEERWGEVSVAEITNEETESDFITFQDASQGGGRDWNLHLVFVQDPGNPDSLFNLTWDLAGTDVPVIVMPYGNAAASASQPHFSGIVTIHYPDGVLLGGEADASNSARMTVETEWPFLQKPTKIVS